MYKDKAFENVIEKYAPKAKAIVTVTPKDKARAVEAFELGKIIKDFNLNVTAADSYVEALEIAKNKMIKGPKIGIMLPIQ